MKIMNVKVKVLPLGLSIVLLLAVVVIVLGYIGGLDNGLSSPLSTQVTLQPGDTVQQISGLMREFTLDDLILESDAIVTGKVADILPARNGTTWDGKPTIYTDVIVQVDRYLYGETKSERIAIQVGGGRIGNTVVLVEDEPVFTLGENIVVFLYRLRYELGFIPGVIDSLSHYGVTGLCMGKFAYQAPGKVVNNGWVKDFPGQAVAVGAIENKVAEIKG
jgi:hypothetical protein